MNALNENVIYRCKCGAEMEWRIVANGVANEAPVAYRNLAASLLKMIQANAKHELDLRLVTQAQVPVVLSRKGKSRSVRIGDGKSRTYGELDLDTGEYNVLHELEGLRALLQEADVSLIDAVRRHGFETDICSFCHRHLTDGRSKQSGYGPKCATKHGQPWPLIRDVVKPLAELKRAWSDLNQDFTYTCACGAVIAWRITSAGIGNITAPSRSVERPRSTTRRVRRTRWSRPRRAVKAAA